MPHPWRKAIISLLKTRVSLSIDGIVIKDFISINYNYESVNDNIEAFLVFYLPQIKSHVKKWYVDKK
jgi:hypothetical protein